MDHWPGYAQLLSSGSATGDWMPWAGGEGCWEVMGTFGGGTAKLQKRKDPASAAQYIDGASFTADGGANFSLPICQVRVELTSASGASLNSWIALVQDGYAKAS